MKELTAEQQVIEILRSYKGGNVSEYLIDAEFIPQIAKRIVLALTAEDENLTAEMVSIEDRGWYVNTTYTCPNCNVQVSIPENK